MPSCCSAVFRVRAPLAFTGTPALGGGGDAAGSQSTRKWLRGIQRAGLHSRKCGTAIIMRAAFFFLCFRVSLIEIIHRLINRPVSCPLNNPKLRSARDPSHNPNAETFRSVTGLFFYFFYFFKEARHVLRDAVRQRDLRIRAPGRR